MVRHLALVVGGALALGAAYPQIIAHRGASTERWENTLAAYERAIELEANFIELDVHLSADGVPICHHDPCIHTEGNPRIVDLSSQQISAMLTGGHTVPTLEQVLQLPRGKTGLMIELKEGYHCPRKLMESVVELVERYDDHTIFIGSLSPFIVALLVERWPRSRLIGIVEPEEHLEQHMASRPHILALYAPIATPEQIRTLKKQGYQVWVWTVDCPEQARRMLQAGAAGIITNDPATLRVLGQECLD